MGKGARGKGFEMVVIGTSHGGFDALKVVLQPLPRDFPAPILVVRHQPPDADDYIVSVLGKVCALAVSFAEDGLLPESGHVYLAPPDRHMTLGADGRIALDDGSKRNFSRPAIDPLFESVANHLGEQVIAVVLTGANGDGAKGAAQVKSNGGTVVVQDPDFAESAEMPMATLAATEVDQVVWLDQIGPLLWSLCRRRRESGR